MEYPGVLDRAAMHFGRQMGTSLKPASGYADDAHPYNRHIFAHRRGFESFAVERREI